MPIHRIPRSCLLAALIALSAAAACETTEPVSPEPELTATTDLEPVDRFARAVSLALADADARVRLLADMRASPFEGHRLHLDSYLNSPAGGSLLSAAAAADETTAADLLGLLDELPELELHVPIPSHRRSWTGTPDVIVVGIDPSRPPEEPTGSVRGFRVSGESLQVPVLSPPPGPVVMMNPVSIDYATTPDRAPAPPVDDSSVGGQTIATRGSFPVEPMLPEADGPDPQAPLATAPMDGKDLGFDFDDCYLTGAIDSDADGLNDICERELAEAFAPEVIFHYLEYWMGREEAWGAQRFYVPAWQTEVVRLVYLLSYYQDKDHTGDSEFVEFWVENHYQNRWSVRYGVLSAHWGTLGNRSWGGLGASFQYADGYLGRPRVWVAKGKHANYRSWYACENTAPAATFEVLDLAWFAFGQPWADDCNTGYQDTLAVHPDRNIGSEFAFGYMGGTAGLDCTRRMLGAPQTGPIECYWTEDVTFGMHGYQSNSRFLGWDGTPSGSSTPYPEILWDLGWKSNRLENPVANLKTWPAPPTPLTVYISGITDWLDEWVWPCEWSATIQGGTPPYSYEWRYDGVLKSTGPCVGDFYPGPVGFHTLSLTLTDNNGHSDSDAITVEIFNF